MSVAAPPPLARDVSELDALLRDRPRPLALVPTMGALHEGHLSLVRAAQARAATVVVSIFVNPTQFGPNEDLGAYPRDEVGDLAALGGTGCSVVWLPRTSVMYPPGDGARVRPGPLARVMDGAARPGHFEGVCTVVAKLFGQVRPDIALFGEKDYQQLRVVQTMNRDLQLGPEVVGVPTVREADGLAMSSRNAYLSAAERERASKLPQMLDRACARLRAGKRADTVLKDGLTGLRTASFAPDYLELRRGDDLTDLPPGPLTTADQATARLFVAARIGGTRLIDNVPVANGTGASLTNA